MRDALDAAVLLAREGMEVPEWSRFTAPEFRAPLPVDPEVGEWSITRNEECGSMATTNPLTYDL